MDRVIVVGGGLAGLAAAVALAPRGFAVTVLEARPRLGGRASSFQDAASGQLVDACQHVSMGCCTNFHHLCDTVGVGRLLAPQPTLYFQTPDRRVSVFKSDPWPAPFHLGRALASAHYLTAAEKARIGYGLLRLLAEPADADPPLHDWLLRHRQTARTIDRFWGVVLTSALNETVDRVGLRYARKVFRDGFVRHRDAFTVHVPTVPLARLYGDELRGWLARHGVAVREGAGVREVSVSTGGLSSTSPREGEVGETQSSRVGGSVLPLSLRGRGPGGGVSDPPPATTSGRDDLPLTGGGEEANPVSVTLRDGNALAADHLILAVPFDRVLDLLPPPVAADPFFARIGKLEPSPITSVHVWYDRPVLNLPHVVLVDCLGQWVFNRGEVAPGEHYLQVVVSAARPLRGLGHDEIRRRVLDELARLYPAAGAATVVRSRVVTEHTATFSAVPGVDALRPTQLTPVPGLYLAGDYTETGWPATMEGAVRSGYLAAEAVLNRAERGERLVRPDLGAGSGM